MFACIRYIIFADPKFIDNPDQSADGLISILGGDKQDLKDKLSTYVEHLKSESNVVITNQRHYESLQKSIDAVYKVKEAITHQISTELLAYELRNALEHLGEISGEFTNDEVLGNIFSKFCIGK